MKYIVHPPTPPGSEPKAAPVQTPPISEISISSLLDDGLLALYREIKNLLALSVKGKLDAPSARDLRDHLKLLFELKDREDQLLRGMSDEELQTQAKAALDNSKQDIPS